MIFEIDRRTVTEGDIVELTWQCEGADSVTLTIDNGFRTTEIPIEISGSKRFRLNRSKGRTHLTIAVSIMGKIYHKKIHVRVKKLPTVKAETIDHNGKRLNFANKWWQSLLTKWQSLRAKENLALQNLPLRKQIALKLLIVVAIMLIISAIWPHFYSFALSILAIILIVMLLKK